MGERSVEQVLCAALCLCTCRSGGLCRGTSRNGSWQHDGFSYQLAWQALCSEFGPLGAYVFTAVGVKGLITFLLAQRPRDVSRRWREALCMKSRAPMDFPARRDGTGSHAGAS